MKKAYLKELQRINQSIPKELRDALMKEELATPAMKEVAMRALDSGLSPEKKEKIQHMIDSGAFDTTVLVTDKEVEDAMSIFLDKEIEKSQRAGRLPKKLSDSWVKKAKQKVRRELSETKDHGESKEIAPAGI